MNSRPLSPHLQAYRLPVTGLISISHRITGAVLSIGALLLLLVPISIALGPDSFKATHAFLASMPGRSLLWLWVLSLLFHLCHGVRHLLWDLGHGYCREHLTRYAVAELIGFGFLVTLVWLASLDSA
ncbi:MAG: succinate dehydrogenase, cytochrome b556 subunit [Methylotetracoccus sp.]|jgi:succinate dehydrogenase / fumarate reductase cytochrome b subunit|nr:succinate dehydrogenase, cytochrome b556 subunit [Methylotetracoccus sp.]